MLGLADRPHLSRAQAARGRNLALRRCAVGMRATQRPPPDPLPCKSRCGHRQHLWPRLGRAAPPRVSHVARLQSDLSSPPHRAGTTSGFSTSSRSSRFRWSVMRYPKSLLVTDLQRLQAVLSFFLIPSRRSHVPVVDLEKAPAPSAPASRPRMDYLGTLVMVSRIYRRSSASS